MAEAWETQRDDIVTQARRLVDAASHSARIEPSAEPLTAALLDEAERGIARTFEPAYGGFGRAPKFPPASTLEFLLRRGSPEAMAMVTKTLDGMAAGGMYDLVGGGFHRYSVDERWLVPHFEKMLYDNALLASTYLHAFVVTGEPRYRAIVEETLDYVMRELRLPDGGLASAQDADTNGVEGLTFTWTEEEGVPAELLQPFEHGRSIIRGSLDPELRARLLAERELRPQPGLDDKVLASWNGLALAALAEGARRLERADWLDAARGVGGVPARAALARRTGASRAPGGRERSAARASSTTTRTWRTACSSSTSRPASRASCTRRTGSRCSRSSCSTIPCTAASSSPRRAARSSSRARRGSTTTRSRPATRCSRTCCCGSAGSGATTSSSASACRCCGSWRRRSTRAPGAFGWTLCALDLWLSPPREIAIVGPADSAVARAALAPFAPNTVVAVGPADGVPLLEGKTPRRRQAGGLRLRAVCLSGAGDRPRGLSRRLISSA